MSLSDERKFLHDLANPLAVAQGGTRIALRRLEQLQMQSEVLTVAEFKERLQKILGACDKIAQLLNERRTLMSSQDTAEE